MAGSLLCGHCAPQPLHHCRVVPLHRAEMPADLASLAVDEQARRQAGSIDGERRLRRRIDVERQRLDPHLRAAALRHLADLKPLPAGAFALFETAAQDSFVRVRSILPEAVMSLPSAVRPTMNSMVLPS